MINLFGCLLLVGYSQLDLDTYISQRTLTRRIKFLFRQIWKVYVPSRIAFFDWEVVCGHIQTIDKLIRRDKIKVSNS